MPTGLNSSTRYLIDIGTELGDPFSGASFTQGALTFNGKTIKATGIAGNMSGWLSYSTTRLNAGTAAACPTRTADYANSMLVFSSPGSVMVRIAWSNGQLEGAMVSSPCRYTITASTTAVSGGTTAAAGATTAAPGATAAATTAAAAAGTTVKAGTPAPNDASIPTCSLSLFVLALTVIQFVSFTMT